MALLGNLFGRKYAGERSSVGRIDPPSREVWSFGPFKLPALPGFTYVSGEAPAVYASVNGGIALISVYVLDGTPPPDQAATIVANARKHVRDTFASSAARFGGGGELSERKQESGDLFLSWPVATRGAGGVEYLLQKAVISPIGSLAIITVEGGGDPATDAIALESAFASARFAV